MEPETGILTNVWVLSDGDLIRARHVGGRGADFHAEKVTIYERNKGALQRVVDAERATPEGRAGGSRMPGIRFPDERRQQRPERFWHGGRHAAAVDPRPGRSGNDQLLRPPPQIDEMEHAGMPTAELRAGLWHKISGPMSSVLMPLLAAVAAFGLARSGQVLLRAVLGMALGFAYFLADNFSLAMGNVGAYPPIIAAWAPFLLFLLIGETVLIRSEEYQRSRSACQRR